MGILETGAALLLGAALAFSGAQHSAAEAAEAADRAAGSACAVVEGYLEENGIAPEQLALGWRDLTTGAEYYVNENEYFYGASLYKLALNMVWAGRVAAGEIDWDYRVGRAKLGELSRGSLEDSNNNYSYILCQGLGSYRKAKLECAPLYGMTPEEAYAEKKYYKDHWITPRQMITCLQKLWDEPEAYPRVTECLLRAQPGRYFRLEEDRWPIAQKYGWLHIGGMDISTAGIVWAPRPFLLVVMTHNLPHAEEHIAALCRLLGDNALALAAPTG